MTYSELFPGEAVLLNMQASDSSSALAALTDHFVSLDSSLAPRRDEIFEALVKREEFGSTGAQQVGIPHVKLPGLDRVYAVVATHQEGVDFNALDGEDVHVLFSVLRPEEGAEEHLGLLKWIAGIAKHGDFVSFAKQAKEPSALTDLLSELAPA